MGVASVCAGGTVLAVLRCVQGMNTGKLRVNKTVVAAIVVALIGGLVIAWFAYHYHAIPAENPFDGVR